jgi:hypothetical protein
MQTKLITFGCSYTYGHGLPDCFISHDKPGNVPSKYSWAALLANRLDLPLENISKCGASNLEILHNILNHEFNRNDLIIIMWSMPDRDTIFDNGQLVPIGAWNDDELTKHWALTHPTEDLAIKSWFYIHHANIYLRSKGVTFYNISAHYSLIKDFKPAFFEIDMLPYDMSVLLDHALDGLHPGVNTHAQLANSILGYLENAKEV